MNLPDLLTYADIDQLRQMADYYKLPRTHSKHTLITSLLTTMQRPSLWVNRTRHLPSAEKRFWQLLLFDSRGSFNLEELLGKARQALKQEDGNPRTLVASAIKSGLLFPGSARRKDRFLYDVPQDVRKHVIRAFRHTFTSSAACPEPSAYRDEQHCLVTDLMRFLSFIGEKGVRLTAASAIHRQDLLMIMRNMTVQEKLPDKKQWRFGFGRRYHQYPDRFSLIYDYAYYRQFISENGHTLSLAVNLNGNKLSQDHEAEQMYNFWLRLYRKPIPALPAIVKWIFLSAGAEWVHASRLRTVVNDWLSPYYYMSKDEQCDLLVKMLAHLGVIRTGDDALQMTECGLAWVGRSAGWELSELEDRYTHVQTDARNEYFFAQEQGNHERALNKNI